MWCYWGHLGEHFVGNRQKKIFSPCPQTQENKLGPCECMLSLLIGCMIFKKNTICHQLQLGLLPIPQSVCTSLMILLINCGFKFY